MALPTTHPLSPPKSPPAVPKRKHAAPVKLKRGGQPGNRNALRSGIFSVQHPSPLGKLRLHINSLKRSYLNRGISPSEVLEQTDPILEKLDNKWSRTKDSRLVLKINNLMLQTIKFRHAVQAALIPYQLKQRALKTIAHDPFGFFERHYRDRGIVRDADSFFFVSKLSARNSPESLSQIAPVGLQTSSSIGGRVRDGAVPPGHPAYATNLTDEQWAVLAPLIPPDPAKDWLLGEPPVIIAASRWDLTPYFPTGEFNDFVIMEKYYQVLQRCPALLEPPPQHASPSRKRGRPRSRPSPRALLDAIIWKLATGRNWDALPLDFPPMRLCRKYYHRLFLSGRLYTLFLALYNHMRIDGETDPELLLEQGIFTTTPSQHIALSPHAAPTWQNYTALLFMQLAREAYSRFEREKKLDHPYYFVCPVFKGTDQLSTGRLPGQPSIPVFQPLEESLLGRRTRKIERDQKTMDRIVAARIKSPQQNRRNSHQKVDMEEETDL